MRSYSSAVACGGSAPCCSARAISPSSAPSRLSRDTISRSLDTRSLARCSAPYSSLWPISRPRSRAFSNVASITSSPVLEFGQNNSLASGQVFCRSNVLVAALLCEQLNYASRLVSSHLQCQQSSWLEVHCRTTYQLADHSEAIRAAVERSSRLPIAHFRHERSPLRIGNV